MRKGWTPPSIRTAGATIDEIFPWEHIDVAVTKKFLTQDYLMSQERRDARRLPRPMFCLRHPAQVKGTAARDAG